MNRVYRHVSAAAQGIRVGLRTAAIACGPQSRLQGLRLAMDRITRLWRWAVQSARLMVGVPDYEVYIAHRRAHHPTEPIMSYAEFFRERQRARYACEKGHFGGCC